MSLGVDTPLAVGKVPSPSPDFPRIRALAGAPREFTVRRVIQHTIHSFLVLVNRLILAVVLLAPPIPVVPVQAEVVPDGLALPDPSDQFGNKVVKLEPVKPVKLTVCGSVKIG